MALTPEDVVNKRFQPTKFREGYDQDEVDDFLDEVVVELRRLNQENEELRQRLIAGESRINELQRSAGSQAAVAAPSYGEQPQYGAPPVVAAAPAPAPAPAPYAAPSDPNAVDPSNTNNLLQLARKLHEEHVREGIEKRDALIAEGHATAAKVVSDAETAQRQQVSALEQERMSLENRIEDLRNFEREYRQKLKSYIEGQLHELESPNALNAAPATPANPTPQVPEGQDATSQDATSHDATSQGASDQGGSDQASSDHSATGESPVAVSSPISQPTPAFNPAQPEQQPASYQGFGGN
jgi:DivIVA domain-containing protein